MNHIKVELDFIPVEERLPELEKPVYILMSGRIEQGWLEENGLWIDDWGAWERNSVTHWAEIPKL